MKKIISYLVLAAVMVGVAKTSSGQVLNSPPRDGIYDKKLP